MRSFRDDAATLARFVREKGLGGLHFWSLDRDAACAADARIVSSSCNGIAGARAFGYSTAFGDSLR